MHMICTDAQVARLCWYLF